MLSRSLLLLLATSTLVLWPMLDARAQEADTTALPEIAPREIEIRGEREIALPSLERQPLTGFASPPSMPTVPTTHRPYVEPYEQELEDLPESLPIPESAATTFTPPGRPASGFIQGGGGRYFSRFLEGRFLAPVSGNELVSVHADYTGMEGFTPFGGDTVDTPSDVLTSRVRFESRRDPIRVEADVHGSAQSYTLYGTPQNPDEADRDAYTIGGMLQLSNTGATDAVAEVTFDHTEYTSNLFGANQRLALDYRERRLGARGELTMPVSLRPHAELAYTQSWFGGNARSDDGYTLDGEGTLTVITNDRTSLEVGGAVLALESPTRPTSTTASAVSETYPAPVIDARWHVSDAATLFVRNHPHLTAASLDGLYATNPYARHAPSLRPNVETTHAHAGLSVSAGAVRFRAETGYRYAPTFRFFEPASQGGLNAGLYDVGYDAAQIIEGRGQIGLQGIRGIQASLQMSVRDGTLQTTDTDIPNFAAVTGTAMAAVSFAGGNGFLSVEGHFEGPRYASRAQSTQLDSYVAVDLEGTYALTESLEVVVRAKNLAPEAPTRWRGYPRPPARITTGVRLNW